MNETAWIVVALVGGIVLGFLAAYAIAAARRATDAERARADTATHQAAIASANGDASAARAEAAQARTELARAETDVERARAEAAEARAEAAGYQADLARQEAVTTTVTVERDAALEQAEQLRADRETMLASYKALSAEALEKQAKSIDETAGQRLQATEQIMKPMAERLEKLDVRLREIENERTELATTMANQVRSVQLTGEQLRKETAALATALRKPTVRGAWGEMQLKRVVEMAGMVDHCDFVTQESTTVDEQVIRPDMRVNLVGGKFVYVDAKTPLQGFLDAELATTEEDRIRHLKAFANRVRAHVNELSSKTYWKADVGTPAFVILFLPSEALLPTALDHAPDLIEHAASKNVVLATPTTLIALLQAISYAWTQEKLAESAREVSELGRELYERLGKMGSHFDRLGRSLDASVRSYNDAIGSLESRVLVSARRLSDLGVSDAEIAPLGPVTTATRGLSAPELVADAVQVPALIGRTPRTASDELLPGVSTPAPHGALLNRLVPATDDAQSSDEPAQSVG